MHHTPGRGDIFTLEVFAVRGRGHSCSAICQFDQVRVWRGKPCEHRGAPRHIFITVNDAVRGVRCRGRGPFHDTCLSRVKTINKNY